MKKLFLIVAVAAMSLTANAQLYIGGNLGFNVNVLDQDVNTKQENDGATKNVNWNLGINPEIGFILNEKMSVGLGVSLAGGQTYTKIEGNKGIPAATFSWGLAPNFKYTFAKVQNLEFKAVAEIAASQDIPFYDGKKLNSSIFNFGIYVFPEVAYNLNEHIELEAKLNCLSIGYSLRANLTDDIDNDKDIYHDFGIDVNKNSFLSVGMIYKF